MARFIPTSPIGMTFDRLFREGRVPDYRIRTFTYPKATVTAGVTVEGTPLTIPAGKSFLIQSITVSADRACYTEGFVTDPNSGFYPGLTSSLAGRQKLYNASFGSNGGSATFDLGGLLIGEGSRVSGNYVPLDTTQVWLQVTLNGIEITNDLNYEADKLVLMLGDSTTWTSMGNDADSRPYVGRDLYSMKICANLRNDGINSRLVNKGFGGAHSIDGYYSLRSGYATIPYDLMLVSYGMNDAASAVNRTTFKSNLIEHIYHRNEHRPNASIVFIAPNTTDVATRLVVDPGETLSRIEIIRECVEDVANDATYGGEARNVYFYDSSTAFGLNADPTLDVNFNNGERTSGSRLHPSGIGHGLIADGLWAVVETTDFYTSNA